MRRSDSFIFSILVITSSVEAYKILLKMHLCIVFPYHICIKGN